jgi:hypothetical protein
MLGEVYNSLARSKPALEAAVKCQSTTDNNPDTNWSSKSEDLTGDGKPDQHIRWMASIGVQTKSYFVSELAFL